MILLYLHISCPGKTRKNPEEIIMSEESPTLYNPVISVKTEHVDKKKYVKEIIFFTLRISTKTNYTITISLLVH